jgi:hypothetical protein
MSKTTRRILSLGVPTAILLFVASPILISLALFSPLFVKDIFLSFWETAQTVHEGEAYGFRVGDTKEQTFADAADLLAKGEFGWLSPWVDRNAYYEIYPTLFDYQPPDQVAAVFEDWVSWKLRGFSDGETKQVQLFFAYPGNTLRQIDWTRHNISGWPTAYPEAWPSGNGLPSIHKGMPSGEVLLALIRLTAHEGYEGMEMTPPYLAWRQITRPEPDDFDRIRPFGEWYVRKLKTPFSTDSIHLKFKGDKLMEIGRYRNYDPFPF